MEKKLAAYSDRFLKADRKTQISWLTFSIGLVYVLIVNGALPGLGLPTQGQALWTLGFAESMANDGFSLYSDDIGLPNPAAMAFGLSGAFLTAIFVKLGFYGADAYALMWVFWISVAYVGAYSLARRFDASKALAVASAVVWLSLPIVWDHAGYSMVSTGIALLPFYINVILKALERRKQDILRIVPLLFFAFIIAAFMDGYSYFMFVSFTCAAIAYDVGMKKNWNYQNYALILSAILLSFGLYSLYAQAGGFDRASMDFFRGWGADLSFIIVPETGRSWLLDGLGFSTNRQGIAYFGDASVYYTTFSIVLIASAVIALRFDYGPRHYKALFFIVGCIALYLALGPSFKFNAINSGAGRLMPPEAAIAPTGTAWLYEHIPGLNVMRATYRWMALAIVMFWFVTVMALSDVRLSKNLRWACVGAIFLIHMPPITSLFSGYMDKRDAFVSRDSDLQIDAALFPKGGTVAFLPNGNDFLANRLWKLYDIKTFNIGGDKNNAIARSAWPSDLMTLRQKRLQVSGRDNILSLLLSGETDAVAISYLNSIPAAHIWPVPLALRDEAQPLVKALKRNPFIDVAEGKYFAVATLMPNIDIAALENYKPLLCTIDGCNQAMSLGTTYPFVELDLPVMSLENWSGQEHWGRWSLGDISSFKIQVPPHQAPIVAEVAAQKLIPDAGSQRISVSFEGSPAQQFEFTSAQRTMLWEIPTAAMADGQLEVEINVFDPVKPSEIYNNNGDTRPLGLGVYSICLREKDQVCESPSP